MYVVSESLLGLALYTSGKPLCLDRYPHWMPSMGRNAADGMDETLG